ncbi:MAG: helix-turn-helix domain-containing protein [Oleiphilus sp.]
MQKKTKKNQSILGLLPLFSAMEKLGHDPSCLLQQRGLSLDGLSGSAVIEQSLSLEIVADAIELIQDPLLGIRAGSQVSFTSYGTFAMLLMTAPNFMDALKAGVQFQSLSLLFSQMTLHILPDFIEVRYILPESSGALRTFVADRDLMGTLTFMNEMVSEPERYLLGIGTARPKPEKQALAEYRHYIPFDLEFDQVNNWIRFSKSILTMGQKHGNKLAHQLYCVQAYELLRKFYPDSDDIVAQTKQIIQGYEAHYPSVPKVAKMFGVSERTFRRKLDEAHTSYRSLLDEHKKQRCLDMLASKTVSVNQLVDALGYSESASFLRAFKRWTGVTPKEYLARENL